MSSTFAMSNAGRGQATAPPLPTTPPPADSTDEENKDSADNVIDAAMDAKFMTDVEQEADEKRAAHAAFNAEQERCREVAAAEDESNDDDFECDWNGLDPEEKVVEQRALVESFETLKKAEDAVNKAMRHRLLEDATAAEHWRPHDGWSGGRRRS
jgi:hypothetical protein